MKAGAARGRTCMKTAGDRSSERKTIPMGLGRRFAAGLAGVALAMPGWGGLLLAQVPEPSAFSETYGNWTVRCAVGQAQEGEPGEGEIRRQCALEQRFIWRDGDSGQRRPLLTVVLTAASAGGGMDAVVMTPFGLRFEPGLRLRVDESPGEVLLEFHTCLPDGCVARGPLAADTIDSFRAGRVLHVEAEPAAGGDPFRLEGSLRGFDSASKRLRLEIEGR